MVIFGEDLIYDCDRFGYESLVNYICFFFMLIIFVIDEVVCVWMLCFLKCFWGGV